MKVVLYTGRLGSFTAEPWREFFDNTVKVGEGMHICFLVDLKGAPDPTVPFKNAKLIADFLTEKMENGLEGTAVVTQTDASEGFARLIESLLPEDVPFFVATNEEEARAWLERFDIEKEIPIQKEAA